MKTNTLLAQLEKDYRQYGWSVILWSAALILYSTFGSPWFFAWVGESWSMDSIKAWNGVFGFLAIALIIAFPFVLLGELYADTPLRTTSFHRTRPVSPLALTLSKTSILLATAVVAPIVASLLSGGGWSTAMSYAPGLFAIGTIILAAGSLTTRGSVLLRGLLFLFILALAAQILRGFFDMRFSNGLGMNWKPNSEPQAWWALPFSVLGISVIYLQYRYARPIIGILTLLIGLLLSAGLIFWIRPMPNVTMEVAGISADNISGSFAQFGAGTHNDVPYVSINFTWDANGLQESMVMELVGTQTVVRGAPTSWSQGAKGFDNPDVLAAQAWGLTEENRSGSLNQSAILKIPTNRLSEVIAQGTSLDITAWFRVVHHGAPTKIPRNTQGIFPVGNGVFHIIEWKKEGSEDLSIEYLWLTHGARDLPAMILVGPENEEWIRKRGRSAFRSGVMGRNSIAGQFGWSSTSRSEEIDGEWVQVQKPGDDWFADSQLWIADTIAKGIVRKQFSFPVELVSPTGTWWAHPLAESQRYRPSRPAISFVNLKQGDVVEIFLRKEEEKPEKFGWADDDTFLFERKDGTIGAIDMPKDKGFRMRSGPSDPRAATDEERASFLKTGTK